MVALHFTSGRRVALVTGASAGIGAAFAMEFGRHGYDLVLVARRKRRLVDLAQTIRSTHGVASLAIDLDLSQRGAPQFLHKRLIEHGVCIDALVNNAGRAAAPFEDDSWSSNEAFLQLMLTTPIELAHLVIPGMRRRNFGRIINVASIAGMLPGSRTGSLYRPAKSFLISFSEMLWSPSPADNVHVTAICPGYVLSDFHDQVSRPLRRPRKSTLLWLDADAVARSGYRAVERNRPVAPVGGLYRTAAVVGRILPRALQRTVESRLRPS